MRANIIKIFMVAGVLASCSNDTETALTFLNGESKTPIAVKTNLSAAPLTRAFDKTFESKDKLYAYIEAGTEAETSSGKVFTSENQFVWKGDFTLSRNITTGTAEGVGDKTSTTEDSDLSPTLYWDDFSSVDYDLRDTDVKRGIRLKYGYCYNGGEANASNSNETAGTLTWTVAADQSTAEGVDMKKSDLLFAATQPMISYGHDPESRGILTMPYTHAMSKITINVTTGKGFDAANTNFSEAVLTLKDMQVKADVNAPAATVTASSDAEAIKDITTFTKSKENTTATYQAIVAPTYLTAGNLLAIIENVGTEASGLNEYNIPLTDGILTAWSKESKLEVCEEVIQNGVAQQKPIFITRATIDHGVAYRTKPGIHYILDVVIDKQKITIRATITDWENVKADGIAQINFNADVTNKGTIADELKAKGFDVYKSSNNTSFTTKSSATFTDGKWNYAPTLYWAGQSDNSYFRALSPVNASATKLTQGVDLLWGTSGDAAIAPRTGDVELSFKHLMSKLSIILETSSDEANKVDLTNAQIKITNLATTAYYSIVNGSISSVSAVEPTMLDGKASGFIESVIPQAIGNNAMIIITLADGTTYSRQLNTCVLTGTETTIDVWTPGKSYTYTIHLEKEAESFNALVEDWVPATGSGNATLEWD